MICLYCNCAHLGLYNLLFSQSSYDKTVYNIMQGKPSH